MRIPALFAVALVPTLLLLALPPEDAPPPTPRPPSAETLPADPEVEEATLPADAPTTAIGRLTLSALVLDRETRAPLVGVEVRGTRGDLEFRARTDRHGRIRRSVDARGSRSWRAEVTIEGYDPYCAWLSLPGVDPRRVGTPPILLDRRTAHLSGVVVDLTGHPVAGASVHVEPDHELTADGSGRFGPIAVPHGGVDVWAASPRHPVTEEYVIVPRGETGEVTIVLSPADFVEGTVVDGEGRPVEGACVASWYFAERRDVMTDAGGGFRWPLAPGLTESLELKADGWVQPDDVPEVFAGTRPVMVLHRAATVSGRVVTADGGPPPPGLEIAFGSAYEALAADGTFSISDAVPGEGTLTVRRTQSTRGTLKADCVAYGKIPLVLAPGERRSAVEVRLPPLRTVVIRFRDLKSGRSIAGVEYLGRVSDASGRLSVRVPRNDSIRGWVAAPGYVPEEHTLPSDVGTTTAALVRAARLRLRVVTPDGRPIPGALVRVKGRASHDRSWGWTDEAGVSTVLARAGTVSVSAVRNSWDRGAKPQVATLVAGRVTEFGDFVVDGPDPRPVDEEETDAAPPDRTITGRILDSAGRPVRGVPVYLEEEYAGTDIRGEFRFEDIAPGENCRLHAEPLGWPILRARAMAGDEVEWRLAPRGTIRVRVALAATRRDRGVPEFCVPDPGDPEADEVIDEDYESLWRYDGDDLLLSVPAGACEFYFRMERDRPTGWMRYPLTIRAGRETVVDYDYPAPGEILGRVLTTDGRPVEDACLFIAATGAEAGWTDEYGEIESGIGVGDWGECLGRQRLRVEAEGFAPLFTAPVDLSRTSRIEVRMSPGVELSGRVRAAGNESLPDEVRLVHEVGAPGWWHDVEEDGSYSLGHVRPGTHAVEYRREDARPLRVSVEVRAGREVSIELP